MGGKFLSAQNKNGHWGKWFYQPKWTSTHYTLLDLKNLCLPKENKKVRKSVGMVLDQPAGKEGGINLAKTIELSDVCLNGMILNYASYFRPEDSKLSSIVDYLLSVQMKDGGWNCEYIHDATHSSLHTTLSVLEGFLEYKKAGVKHRLKEIEKVQKDGIEFILEHKMFQSHRTGEIIDKKMLMLSYPSRWRYDILRALDFFWAAKIGYDERMDPAIKILLKKQKNEGRWPLQMKHKGQVHFDMEEPGGKSRWNTLRAIRVLRYYEIDHGFS